MYKRQMQGRQSYVSRGNSDIRPVEGMDRTAAVIYPIIASSDVTGAVILLNSESSVAAGEAEAKLAQAAAAFLGKQMEE